MNEYWKITTVFLLLVIAGMTIFIFRHGRVYAHRECDTIRDTIVIYKFIEKDWDEQEEADWY